MLRLIEWNKKLCEIRDNHWIKEISRFEEKKSCKCCKSNMIMKKF